MQPYRRQEEKEQPERKGFGWLVVAVLLGILFAVGMILGCSPAHKLAKAERKITRIATNVPGSIVKPCNIFLPPIISSDSMRIEYRSGIPIVTHDTVVTTDEHTNIVTRTVKEKITLHDTVVVNHDRTVVDQKPLALEKQKAEVLTKERDGAIVSSAKKSTKISILTWSLAILGAYTLARWLCKYFFHFNLP